MRDASTHRSMSRSEGCNSPIYPPLHIPHRQPARTSRVSSGGLFPPAKCARQNVFRKAWAPRRRPFCTRACLQRRNCHALGERGFACTPNLLALASPFRMAKKLADRPSWTVGLNTHQKSRIALTFGTVTIKHGTPYNNSCMRKTTPGDPQALSPSPWCLTGAPGRTRLWLRRRPSVMRHTDFVRCTLEAQLIRPETGSGLGAQFAHGRRSCSDFSAPWH